MTSQPSRSEKKHCVLDIFRQHGYIGRQTAAEMDTRHFRNGRFVGYADLQRDNSPNMGDRCEILLKVLGQVSGHAQDESDNVAALATLLDQSGIRTLEEAIDWIFEPPVEEKLLGEVLLSGTTLSTTVSALKHRPCLLYFSAHWCPPCRKFTPQLARAYRAHRAAGGRAEIIYVSSDRTPEQFKEYFAEMPWLAVPFEGTTALRAELKSRMVPAGIPFLCALELDFSELSPGLNFRSAVQESGADSELLRLTALRGFANREGQRRDACRAGEALSMQHQEAFGGPILQRLSGDPAEQVADFDPQSHRLSFVNGFHSWGAPGMLTTSGILYYELKLLSVAGIAQLGFATKAFHGTRNGGVGDDVESWGIDGMRRQLFSEGKAALYNDKWKEGDVISLAANLDLGQIALAKNGDWTPDGGPVVKSNRIKDGIFPAFTARGVSLGYNLDGVTHGPFMYGLPSQSIWRP